MREQDIERLGASLGAEQARAIDPDRVAQAVRRRLASGEQTVRRPKHLARWGLAVAAGLIVTVAINRAPDADAITPAVAAPVTLSDLDSDGLGAALDSLVANAPASEFVGWGIGTMSADELQALLAAMEG